MNLEQRIVAARVAESALVAQHTEFRGHLGEVHQLREQLVTPGRIVFGGLAVGYLAGRFGPELRRPEVAASVERSADLLHHVTQLASSALPLLMPFLIARSAARVAEVAEPEVEQAPAQA
jgi:hypothetical protein